MRRSGCSPGMSSAIFSTGCKGRPISAWRRWPSRPPRKTDRMIGDRPAPVRIVGLVADDTADAMVLRMLGQLLAPSGCILESIADAESSLQVAERVAEHSPTLVVVSHLPPAGLTLARYLVRRLRARFAELPIVVGHWGETTGSAAAAKQLIGIGASRVVFTLADARAHILAELAPEPKDAAPASSAPLG